MNLQDLEVFMEIATLGGFNRAATHLHVAQSALSRRVARLEYEIGTPLLIRNKQGVQLTPAGAILLERSQSLLRHFDQVEAEIKAEASEPRGEVTLGLPPSLLHSASTLLSTLRSRYALLFVRSWVATSVDLRGMLLSGKLDVAVYASVESETFLATRELFSEPLHLAGPKIPSVNGHIGWKEIAELPLILTSRPNSVRILVDTEAAKHGVKLNVALEVNDVSLLLRLVEDGIGYTILPASAFDKVADRQRLWELPAPSLKLTWIVANSKERPLSIGAKSTIAVIEEVMGRPKKKQPRVVSQPPANARAT